MCDIRGFENVFSLVSQIIIPTEWDELDEREEIIKTHTIEFRLFSAAHLSDHTERNLTQDWVAMGFFASFAAAFSYRVFFFSFSLRQRSAYTQQTSIQLMYMRRNGSGSDEELNTEIKTVAAAVSKWQRVKIDDELLMLCVLQNCHETR